MPHRGYGDLLVMEKKWELRIVNTGREKKEVFNMATKEKPNSKENEESLEVEVMNIRSVSRYIKEYDGGARVPENTATSKDPSERESQSFKYDFIDHLSLGPCKNLLTRLVQARTRKMLAIVLA